MTNTTRDSPESADKAEKARPAVGCRLSFLRELRELINKHRKESASDTPDFILAQYLNNCLTNFDLALQHRSDWYSG